MKVIEDLENEKVLVQMDRNEFNILDKIFDYIRKLKG